MLRQTDTYFRAREGSRLKLREHGDGGAELIAYERADVARLRSSRYLRRPVGDAGGLRGALGLALGVSAVVVKQRRLYLVGRTRVHLDEVEGLGRFVELEVVLAPGESVERGLEEGTALLEALGLESAIPIEGSYGDLVT